MKHIVISEDLHQALRLKSIHSKKTLQEVANEIITDALYTNSQPTQGN